MYSKEEVVKEQMRKLDHSHTTIERALSDAWDAGRLSAGAAVADAIGEADQSPAPKRGKKKSE